MLPPVTLLFPLFFNDHLQDGVRTKPRNLKRVSYFISIDFVFKPKTRTIGGFVKKIVWKACLSRGISNVEAVGADLLAVWFLPASEDCYHTSAVHIAKLR